MKVVELKSKKHPDTIYIVQSRSFFKLVYDNHGYYYGSFHTGKDNQELLIECDNTKEL